MVNLSSEKSIEVQCDQQKSAKTSYHLKFLSIFLGSSKMVLCPSGEIKINFVLLRHYITWKFFLFNHFSPINTSKRELIRLLIEVAVITFRYLILDEVSVRFYFWIIFYTYCSICYYRFYKNG